MIVGANHFLISYVGGTGNDVVLTVDNTAPSTTMRAREAGSLSGITTAIDRPSGDHASDSTPDGARVICTGAPLAPDTSHSCGLPERSDRKAIDVPSGDHAGATSRGPFVS